jgi:DNA (cytosine-5)-methyltransferase 1
VRVVSLFAGIGGFDLGFQQAGHKIVAHVEKDAACLKLLKAKWPNAVALDDVRTAGRHNLPDCDLVTFGFPCQDLSVAGKRAGLAGQRSGLFYEATRIINELRPAFALWENVPGLLSSDQGRDFARVLLELDRIGYHGAWRTLDAQYYGLAQRRRRVFGLFSCLDSGAARCSQILSLAEGVRGHPAPRREAGQGVAGSLESRTDGGGFPGTDGACAGHVVPEVAWALQERDAKGCDSSTKDGHLVVDVADNGGWRRVSFAGDAVCECGDTGCHGECGCVLHCSICCNDYAECGCPGPTQDGIEYREVNGVLYGRPVVAHAFDARQSDVLQYGDKTGPLDTDGCSMAVAFKPSHFTRGKDGAPAEVHPPLSADADKGDQEAVVAFQPRIARNGRGNMGEVLNALQAQSGQTGKGDAAPCVAITNWDTQRRRVHDENGVAPTLSSEEGRGQGVPTVATRLCVRRLTPRECERL